MAKFKLGREFGQAVCAHYKLDPSMVTTVEVYSGNDEVLRLQISIAFTADDLASIATLMQDQRARAK